MFKEGFTSPTPARGVSVHEHCNYLGNAVTNLTPGTYDMNALSQKGMANDAISSLRVPCNSHVVLHEHGDFSGQRRDVRADTPCLAQSWNDVTSAISVLPPGTYGSTCTGCTTSSSGYWLNNCTCKKNNGQDNRNGPFRAGDCGGRLIHNLDGVLRC